MATPGTVYLIGAGPGDPELITLRARSRLASADLVLYDALIHDELLAHCRPDAELVFVGKRAGRTQQRQASINERMVEAARAGRSVARLKGGDPYLFGRGSEEAEFLADAGIPFEVVPGVPSPLAATAYAGISLSHRELASSIAYLTATESIEKDRSAHDWSRLATATQTLVIFMGVRKLDSLMKLLVEHGRPPSCPVAVIQWASLPKQKTVVGTVETIAARVQEAGLGLPAITVVGDVVALRDKLRWYDLKPLFGKRVLVTRAAAQSPTLVQALRRAGAQPLCHPVIEITPPDDPTAFSEAVAQVGDHDWLVFTSANGVHAFFTELHAQGADSRKLGGVRVAAIGPATAEAIAAHGVTADVVPDEYRGEAAATAILAHHDGHMNALSVLLPRAAVARDALPDMLRAAGARVHVVPAYRTRPPSEQSMAALRSLLEAGGVDIVTFTSSSTVSNTLAALGEGEAAAALLAPLTIASIGPITTQTATAAGVHVNLTASDYTVPGLVAALEQHFTDA